MTFDKSTARIWLGDEDLGVFDYPKQPIGEARFFKKITGMSPFEMMQGLQTSDPDAVAAYVWLMWRRKGRIVDYNAVDFTMGDIQLKDADGNAPTAAEIEQIQAEQAGLIGPSGPTVPAGNATTPAGTSSDADSPTSPVSLTSSI